MDVSATYKGEDARILDIDVNGSSIYVTYVNTGGDFKVGQSVMTFPLSASTTIATGVTVN